MDGYLLFPQFSHGFPLSACLPVCLTKTAVLLDHAHPNGFILITVLKAPSPNTVTF